MERGDIYLVSLDPTGRVTTINGAAERMLGLPASRIQDKAAATVFRSPEYAEIATPILRMGRARDGMLEREVHLRRDGQTVALLASATALKGPDASYMGMVLAFETPWYIKGLGGFIIEDQVLITETGSEALTRVERQLVVR